MSISKEEQLESTTPQPGEPQAQQLAHQKRIKRWFEVISAIMLGVVAVATAWSGYQATRWAGVQASLYVEASSLRVESTRDSTLAGQLRIYDINLFDEWLNAYSHGDSKLAGIYQRRFRPEFQPAFTSWLATNPLNQSNAPPSPLFMPQYKLSLDTQANQLATKASQTFDAGQVANQQSDDYVLNTVFLATVLLLTSIADRFEWIQVRAMILLFGMGLLAFGLYHIAIYPIN